MSQNNAKALYRANKMEELEQEAEKEEDQAETLLAAIKELGMDCFADAFHDNILGAAVIDPEEFFSNDPLIGKEFREVYIQKINELYCDLYLKFMRRADPAHISKTFAALSEGDIPKTAILEQVLDDLNNP